MEPTSIPQAPLIPKKPSKLPLIIGVVVLTAALVAAALYFLVFGAIRGATATGDKFVSAIQKQDAAAAYSLASDAFKNNTTKADLETILKSISPALQGPVRQEGNKIENRGGKSLAAIVYAIKTASGDNYIRVILQKETNGWQVTNFRSSASKLDTTIE